MEDRVNLCLFHSRRRRRRRRPTTDTLIISSQQQEMWLEIKINFNWTDEINQSAHYDSGCQFDYV